MSIKVLKGSKGGGGSTFKQTPDNMRSEDTFEGLMGVCIGPIKGPVDGLKSVKLDGTPIENSTGETNFPGFVAFMSTGNPINHPEKPKLRLGAGAAPMSVGAGLVNTVGPGSGIWVTRQLANTSPDYIDLRFIAQQLYKQDKKGIFPHSATIEIEMKPTGSSTWINPTMGTGDPNATNPTAGKQDGQDFGEFLFDAGFFEDRTPAAGTSSNFVIQGKTNAPAVYELRIWVPTEGAYANVQWDVRARLVEKDSVDADPNFEKRIIAWESMAAVYTDELGEEEEWRGVSWLQFYGTASDQLSGVPDVQVETDAKVVSVPPATLYNPETRVYQPGIWDGSWAKGWTNDPAWVINDAISDELSGMSLLAPGSHLNKWDALEASKWFSEMVPDGKGGTHPRFSLNVVANQQMKGEEFIRYLAGAVSGFAWDEGNGEWRMKVDKADAPVDLFTLDNIEGEFVYSHTDVDTRYNDITGTFLNAEMDYAEDSLHVYDNASIAKIGHKPTNIALVGCTNRQEAMRRLMLRLRTATNETRLVTFTTNRRGRNVEQLDTILVADGHLGDLSQRTYGRTITVAPDRMSIIVRDPMRLELNVAYKMKFSYQNPNYNPATGSQPTNADWKKPTIVAERNITNTAGQRGDVTTIYLDAALPAGLPDNLAVALEATNLPAIPKMYRVTNVSYEDDSERVAISAIEVDTGKWFAADNVSNVNTVFQDLRGDVPMPLLPVDGDLAKLIRTEADQGDNVSLILNWQRPPGAQVAGFRVTYRVNGGNEIVLTEQTTLTQADIVNPPHGTYEFYVYTINRRGTRSAPLSTIQIVDPSTILAGQILYADGQSIEALQPAVAGATRNYPRGQWAAGQNYEEGDIFSYDGAAYIVTATHTSSGSSPDLTKATLLVDGGQPGLNNATVYLYQRAASPPALPSADVTYSFAGGTVSGQNNGWSPTIPTANGNPLYVTVATASADGPLDVIAPNEWAGTTILTQDGTTGLSVATIFLYQRSASVPTKPSVATNFTFSTGVLTGQNNGWSQTVPANDGNPLYITTATASAVGDTDTVPATEWAAPQVLASNGASVPGLNNAVLYIYQRSASQPSLPSANVTYTFSNGGYAGLNNGWAPTIPADNGQPLWVALATASSANTTDTVAPTDWTTPQILAQNGTAGLSVATVFLYKRATSLPAKPSIATTFTFATGVLTAPDNGWSQTLPAGTDPVYMTTATAAAVGATDTIPASEWAAPAVLAQNGTTGPAGLNQATIYIYQRANSVPDAPSINVDYTFATGVTTALNNNWQRNIPANNGLPLWVTVASATGTGATDTLVPSDWAPVQQLATDGNSGIQAATVYLYQRATSTPAVPSVNVTYTFASGVLTNQNNGWVTSIPTGTNPLYVTTATALATAGTTTDSIAPAEWATPVVLARTGDTGPAGPALVVTVDRGAFTYLDGLLSPATGQVATFTATPQNAPGTISWVTNPVIAGKNGATGTTLTLTPDDMGTINSVEIHATVGSIISNSITMTKAADPIADRTQDNTAADTIAVAGTLAGTIRDGAATATAMSADITDNTTFSRTEKERYVNQVDEWAVTVPAAIYQLNQFGLTTAANNLQTAWDSGSPLANNTGGFLNYLYYVGYGDTSYSSTTQTGFNRTTFNNKSSAFINALQSAANTLDAHAATVASWGGVTGTGRPSDNAGVTVSLFDATGGRYTIQGNTLFVTNGSWTGNAYSREAYNGGAFVRFNLQSNAGMGGLSYDYSSPASNSYQNIAYAIQPVGDKWFIYESGAYVTQGAWNGTDDVTVVYDNHYIKYFVRDLVVRTVFAGQGRSFTAAFAGGGSGLSFSNIQFGPYTSNAWSGIAGDGRPTNYADVTGDNIANGFEGSGDLAYRNTARWGVDVEGRPNMLTNLHYSDGDYRINAYYIRNSENTAYLAERFPEEANANRTEGRTANSFLGRGDLASQNVAYPRQLLTGTPDNVIPDNEFRDPAWWNIGNAISFVDTSLAWALPRAMFSSLDQDFDYSSNYFTLEVGGVYEVYFRSYNLDVDPGVGSYMTGGFWPLIHMPNVAWYSLRHGYPVNPDVVDSGNAIVTPQDTGVLRYQFTVTNENMRRIQFRMKSNARGNNLTWQFSLRKVQDAGRLAGRIANPRIYNTQAILGPTSTSNLNPTYSDNNGTSVLVTLPAHNRYIAGTAGPVTLYYGAASFRVNVSTYWTAFCDDPDLTGFASPNVGVTGDPNQLLYPHRYQLASGFTPNAAGTGGSTGGGGGGGGGAIENCVEVCSYMPTGQLAGDVKRGDEIYSLNEETWDSAVLRPVESNKVALADCVEITSKSGIKLVLSTTTPCTLHGGEVVNVTDVLGHELAVQDDKGFRWEEIVETEFVGKRLVAHISCNQGTYAAGKEEGRYIFTHNPVVKP